MLLARARRALSTEAIHVPDHLRRFQALNMPMPTGRCMIVGQPRYHYAIAVVPPPAEVAPLFAAIRACDHRPFRIVSYEDEAGKVFNCSFFNDASHMQAWLAWLDENALSSDSPYHESMVSAAAEVPSSADLLFGKGTRVFKDTRFGEYQVGMAINFSRQVPVSDAAHADMCDVMASADFEQRIARCMQEHNVAYFGRLAMFEDADADSGGAPPALLTALRYGSIDDAKRGTAVVRELARPELSRWFNNEVTSLLGTTTQVLEL